MAQWANPKKSYCACDQHGEVCSCCLVSLIVGTVFVVFCASECQSQKVDVSVQRRVT